MGREAASAVHGPANAWIIDLKSRSVVWELSAATTSRGTADTQTFSGTATLPAGSYEAFYAFYPATYWSDERQGGKEKPPGSALERDGLRTIDTLGLKIAATARS